MLTPQLPAEIAATLCEATRIVRRHLPDRRYRVFLFGSWAAGRAHACSDIDIGIEGPAPVPAGAMAEIREACEAVATLRVIEVVDFARMGEMVRREARRRVVEAEAA